MKTPTKKQKEFVYDCVNKACDVLLLNSFSKTWNWYNEDKIGVKKDVKTAVEISTDLTYKELELDVYPVFWKQVEVKQFDVIFHELCHVLTENQYMLSVHFTNGKFITPREIEEVREKETVLIEKAFVWLFSNPEIYKEVVDFRKKLAHSVEYNPEKPKKKKGRSDTIGNNKKFMAKKKPVKKVAKKAVKL